MKPIWKIQSIYEIDTNLQMRNFGKEESLRDDILQLPKELPNKNIYFRFWIQYVKKCNRTLDQICRDRENFLMERLNGILTVQKLLQEYRKLSRAKNTGIKELCWTLIKTPYALRSYNFGELIKTSY